MRVSPARTDRRRAMAGSITLSWCSVVIVLYTLATCVVGTKLSGNEIHVDFHAVDDVTTQTEADACGQQMARVYNDDVTTPYPPPLAGEWTSSRCEIRPGPEFLLRKYRFSRTHFTLHQFFYHDALCRHPSHVITSRGSYDVYQPSWLLPGATEVEYQLNHVTVVAYTDKVAADIGRSVNKTCTGYVKTDWRKDRAYDVFNYVEVTEGADPDEDSYLLLDRDCLDALGFSAHELQLLRLEVRARHGHHSDETLYLGDIHTRRDQRRTYRPTAFQGPMYRPEKVHNCPTCTLVQLADEYYPPTPRHHRPAADLVLQGSWFSARCETRPNGIFLTRHLSFSDDNRTWDGYYHHFLDSHCRRPQFTVHVRGKYSLAQRSQAIQGAYEMDFQVLKARIKPTDPSIVNLLNQRRNKKTRCGESTAPWQLDVDDDVTATSGCPVLGITLPHLEFEIMKVETTHKTSMLYLGQRPTEGTLFSTFKRPTSFQTPLVRCSDDMTAVTPPYQFHVLPTASAAGHQCGLSLLLVTILTLGRLSRLDTMD